LFLFAFKLTLPEHKEMPLSVTITPPHYLVPDWLLDFSIHALQTKFKHYNLTDMFIQSIIKYNMQKQMESKCTDVANL